MAMPTNFPIRPIQRPSDLNGITNGQVPESLLVPIGKRGSKMHHTAARGWYCLMWHLSQHLAELGIDDWDVSSIDPRTYQRQCEMFDGRRYVSGRYLPQSMWAAWEARGGKWGKRDDGSIQQYTWTAQDRTSPELWRRKYPLAMAAKPGTSPHGDALAVDLAVDDDDDSIADPITEAVVRFLMADNLALNCGFAWSTKSEPWHLQWYCGDAVPPMVIAWEQGQHPAPDPQPQPTPTPVPTASDVDTYPPGSKDIMYPIDYGVAGKDSWWHEMAITPKGLQWSGGPSPQSQKIRQILAAVPMPRAPRLVDDNDVINLMQAIGTFGVSPYQPGSPAVNAGLDAHWAANLNKGR